MEHLNLAFWRKLKNLTSRDSSREVPETVVARTLGMFQRKPPNRPFVMKLRPMALGLVRGDTDINRSVYEVDDLGWITLEHMIYPEGITLHGRVQGFSAPSVTLFGEEFSTDTHVESGTFEFTQLPYGRYNLTVTHNKEPYWIVDLELRGETRD